MYYCYLLYHINNKNNISYIGATINLDKRLKQHNGLLSGGAKYTKGKKWNRICYITGFNTWNDCLKFEWRWKWFSKKTSGNTIHKRLFGLKKTIEWFNWTYLDIILDSNITWEYIFLHYNNFTQFNLCL